MTRGLREHLQELDRRGLLRRVSIPVNKAALAVLGDYYQTGTKQAGQRISTEGS